MSCLPKPVLRRYVHRRGLRAIVGGLTLACICSATYHFTVSIPRKKAYQEFYKTYDPEQHYRDMIKWGYMTDVKKLIQNKQEK